MFSDLRAPHSVVARVAHPDFGHWIDTYLSNVDRVQYVFEVTQFLHKQFEGNEVFAKRFANHFDRWVVRLARKSDPHRLGELLKLGDRKGFPMRWTHELCGKKPLTAENLIAAAKGVPAKEIAANCFEILSPVRGLNTDRKLQR
jgi:hypothetical protein